MKLTALLTSIFWGCPSLEMSSRTITMLKNVVARDLEEVVRSPATNIFFVINFKRLPSI
jgi:hypothetical protein